MPNWCSTDYVIRGSKDAVHKIYDAISNPTVKPNSSKDWEGNVLLTLGINFDELKYMRGFINDVAEIKDDSEDISTLSFNAEEAWETTDFCEILQKAYPDDIEIYWYAAEPGMEIYETNDSEGVYFNNGYYVDTYVNGDYQSECFSSEKEVLDWLIDNFGLRSMKDVEEFNKKNDDYYIYVHKIRVVN